MRVETPDGAVTGARIAGANGPALVFVHGVGSTAAIWDAQLAAFSNDFRCAAIELRGNGALEDPDPSLITRAGFAGDKACEVSHVDNEHSTDFVRDLAEFREIK